MCEPVFEGGQQKNSKRRANEKKKMDTTYHMLVLNVFFATDWVAAILVTIPNMSAR